MSCSAYFLSLLSSVPGARAASPCGDRPPQPSTGLGQLLLLEEGEADARVRGRGVRLEGAARAGEEGDAVRRDAPLAQRVGVGAAQVDPQEVARGRAGHDGRQAFGQLAVDRGGKEGGPAREGGTKPLQVLADGAPLDHRRDQRLYLVRVRVRVRVRVGVRVRFRVSKVRVRVRVRVI